MLALLLAAALLAAPLTRAQTAPAATAPAPDELLEFDPPLDAFHLAEQRDAPSTFRVRLRRRPRAPTTVYLESANIKFARCQEQWGVHDWNEWRPVEVRALPYFTDADRERGEVISMRISCPQGHAGWHARNYTYPVHRPKGLKGATCASNGDPHIRTFDGRNYDYMGLGTYYLLRSPALTIQTVTDVWSPGTTVSVATAIRYGPAHFIVDARESQGDKRLVRLSGDAAGIDIQVSAAHNEFRFRFPNGAAITITYHAANPRPYLDHTIEVPACLRGRTNGLCGTFDGNQANDWTLPGGGVAPDAKTFGDAWAVPPTDCIFTCRDRCPDAKPALIQPCDQCRIPTSLTGPGVFRDVPEGYLPFRGARTPYDRGLPRYTDETRRLLRAPRPRVSPEFEERATRACTEALALPDAHAVLSPRPYLDACVADCRLTGTLQMVDAKKTAYLNDVYARVRPVLNLVGSAPVARTRRGGAYAASHEATQCRRAADVLGLGSRRCPRDCSGQGTCLRGGCVCRPGYTGLACATRLSSYGVPVAPGRGRLAEVAHVPPRRGAYARGDMMDDVEYEVPPPRFGTTPRPRPVLAHPRTQVDIFEGEEEEMAMTNELGGPEAEEPEA